MAASRAILADERDPLTDCALTTRVQGFKTSTSRAKKNVISRNLQLLQRIGQRLLTEVFTHQSTATCKNPPTLCKSVFAKINQSQREEWGATTRSSDNEVAFCSPNELAVTLVRTYNSCENYLRTGKYVEMQLTPTNDVAKRSGAALSGGPRDTNVDAMCLLAVDGAAETFADLCVRGPMAMSSLTALDVFLVSPHESAPCCMCKKPVHVLKAQVLPLGGSACLNCRRRRCFSCTDIVVSSDDENWNPCRFCDPASVHEEDIESY